MIFLAWIALIWDHADLPRYLGWFYMCLYVDGSVNDQVSSTCYIALRGYFAVQQNNNRRGPVPRARDLDTCT
ncbi:hypothetical protein F4818DRAFT_398439 [Hypoxylon cercidicola]|nr:hypothetical protein F4818DRAFT_398439 [Hypoxylon cercidicola]